MGVATTQFDHVQNQMFYASLQTFSAEVCATEYKGVLKH